ncbi:MAG: hypothetical protein ACW98F_07490, partial [Candidatus Hodarchaeales archaeon]
MMKKGNRDIQLEKDVVWSVKKGLEFNPESETFLDYIMKEKKIFDRHRPLKKLAPIIGVLIGLAILFLYSSMMLIDFMILFFLEGEFIGPADLQSNFFSLLVLTSVLASVLGQILVIFSLSFKYFFTKESWSKFHDQTISLVERLLEMNRLEEYIQFIHDENGQTGFKLKTVSVDFQVQWIFPF